MSAPEFSRPVKDRQLPAEQVRIHAKPDECAALAQRFAIPSVKRLKAEITLQPDGKAVLATGQFSARIIQTCAVSGDDFATVVSEKLRLHFIEVTPAPVTKEGEEIEVDLTSGDSDEIEYAGGIFDLGEAVAQTLGLAIDPYAEGPDADAVRAKAGLSADDQPSGPLAEALAALKKG